MSEGRVRKPNNLDFFESIGQGKSYKKQNVAPASNKTKSPGVDRGGRGAGRPPSGRGRGRPPGRGTVKAVHKSSTVPRLPATPRAIWVPPSVVLSLRDKAPQLELSNDQLTCVGQDGFRMIRATQGVHCGSYYYEVEILEPESDDAHVRVGWSTRQGELQSFVGYDKWSYGFRDLGGSLVHGSKRYDGYGLSIRDASTAGEQGKTVMDATLSANIDAMPPSSSSSSSSSEGKTNGSNSESTKPCGYGPGDIVGCYIHLDDHNALNNHIRFYKNGVDLGLAFCNVANDDTARAFPNDAPLTSSRADFSTAQLPPAVYYPAISLYKKACVRVNFGPSFILRPMQHHGAMSLSEVQPMSPLSRRIHERNIRSIQQAKLLPIAGVGASIAASSSTAALTSMVVLTRDSCADTRQQEDDETAGDTS